MKQRPNGFLANEFISHKSEQFDYIAELHNYLWRFVRSVIPSANGDLSLFVDLAVIKSAQQSVHLTALRRVLWVSFCVHVISVLVLLYSVFGGR
jgi:hypothetical protein